MRSLPTTLAALLAAAVLAGCSSTGDDTVVEDPATASTATPPPGRSDAEPSAQAPCDVVADEQITEWAGTTQTVNGPQQVGAIQECTTVVEPGDSLGLLWSFAERAPLADLVEQENLDGRLDEQDLDLGGGARAVLLTGEIAGETSAVVVAVVDEGALVVTARDNGLGDRPRDVDDLASIATDVAGVYAR